MKFSVIIPVRNLTDYLKESIIHLKKVRYYDFEVIIVMDEVIKINFGLKEDRFKVISSGSVGPGEKRNIGAKEAKGDVLVFLDDDAYPDTNWLRAAANIFEQNPDLYALGGPAMTPPMVEIKEKMAGYIIESYLTGANTTYRYKPAGRREVVDFPSVNLFVKKDAFFAVGGFDPNYWPGEDTKLCLDLYKKYKKKFLYDPKPQVFHHRRELYKPFLEQISRYGKHRGYFARIFPKTSRKLVFFIPSIFVLWSVFGFVLSLINFKIFPYYLLIWFLYLTLVFAEAQRVSMLEKDFEAFKYMFVGIIKTHYKYGVSFLKGLVYRPKLELRTYDNSTGNYVGG